MKRFIIVSIFLLLVVNIFSQKLSENDFSKLLRNKSDLYFDKANGKYFGCGMNLDCMGLPILFKSVELDRMARKLVLTGFVNPITQDSDTIGTNIFRIFIAKPVKGKLKRIRILAEVVDTIKAVAPNTTVDIKALSFKTSFQFSKHDCLYIESNEMFRLKEYDIGSLLELKTK